MTQKNSYQQRKLKEDRVAEFYHDNFVADQVRDFIALIGDTPTSGALVVDVGGGCGFFARALRSNSSWQVRVLDMDPTSIRICHESGIDAEVADALSPSKRPGDNVVAFNLILHHLVGVDELTTRELQLMALKVWDGRAEKIFINEYIYESFCFERLSGWLIFTVTRSRALSFFGRLVSRFTPSLHANTFDTGVRFRAAREWILLFEKAGFEVMAHKQGEKEPVSLARRLLFIRNCRRDSFVLCRRGSDKSK